MGMREMIEEAFDVGLNHPLRFCVGDDLRDPPQRIVRATTGTKAIRAVAKFRLPDGLQEAAEPILHQSVLEARHTQRTVASIPLGM